MMLIRKNKGFALAFSLLFLLLSLAPIEVLVLSASSGITTANRSADLKRAAYIADMGIADAFIQLRGYASPPLSFNVNNAAVVVGGKTGSYAVAVDGAGAPWLRYTITSTGTYHGQTKTLVLTVQQTAVSSFAYLSQTEINPVYGTLWWITGMTTVGPTRTNGRLNIWGSPVFDGTVTQSAATINYWNGGPPIDNPVWVDGLTLGASAIALPTSTVLGTLKTAASGSGLLLTGNSTVKFNSSGTINVTNAALGWNNHSMSIPSNGTIYVQNGSVTVQGTIRGQATVASDAEVYISGNLLYHTNPRTDPTSTDLLGLVAKNNVTVLAASSPTNLELDAVLVALTGSFQVDQWWVSGKGNMIQYGSLINNYCGPTGIFDPETGVLSGGYNQLQYFDPRLRSMIPPSFPPAQDASGRILYVKISFQEL